MSSLLTKPLRYIIVATNTLRGRQAIFTGCDWHTSTCHLKEYTIPTVCGRPHRSGHIGDEEIPGQEHEMSLGRRVAAFLRRGAGLPPPVIDDGLGHPHGNQARGHMVAWPQKHRLLQQGTRVVPETLG